MQVLFVMAGILASTQQGDAEASHLSDRPCMCIALWTLVKLSNCSHETLDYKSHDHLMKDMDDFMQCVY